MEPLTILTNEDVDRLVAMRDAVQAVEGALARKGAGDFITPPRHYLSTRKGTLAFTIGGDAEEGVVGFRVYAMFPGSREDDQFVAVYGATGELRGVVKGARVGAMRTGALGGVAIKYAARETAKTVAVIGSGVQARTQLEAAAVVRDLSEARVYSRSPQNREAFASDMNARLGLSVSPAETAEEAIAGADIVIVATSSRAPVFDASLVRAGMHVTTVRLGRGEHELDARVAERAGAMFTDSLEQVRSYPRGFFLEDRLDSITDLCEHVVRRTPVRTSEDEITLYLSAGLSGTEVVVADLALQRAGV